MKALVKRHSEPGLWLEEVPEPAPGPNDVLIRVNRTGICGTDLHIFNWDAWAQKTIPVPMVVGHEFVGRVVDVGANLGYYALLASRLVGASGRVIALEPNSENCRLLLSSLRMGGVTNVQLLPVAADTDTGWGYYSTHVGSNGGLIEDQDLLRHPGTVVPTFRLDDIVDGPVGFLKMDVEGAEGRVVRGATGLIERDRPIITTELKDEMLRRVSGTSVAEYLGYFESVGYTPALLEKATGAEKPYPSVAALLADWGETDELRDVLLVPSPR